MNYIAVFKKGGDLKSSFFYEYNSSTISISSIEDVINYLERYIHPDNNTLIIKETLLDSEVLSDLKIITELYNLYSKYN